jgi:hypothetical protein
MDPQTKAQTKSSNRREDNQQYLGDYLRRLANSLNQKAKVVDCGISRPNKDT